MVARRVEQQPALCDQSQRTAKLVRSICPLGHSPQSAGRGQSAIPEITGANRTDDHPRSCGVGFCIPPTGPADPFT